MLEKELIAKLEQRVEEINRLFPNEKVTLETLLNKILTKYLERKEESNKTTSGTEWVNFRRKIAKKMWQEAKHQCFYCKRQISFRLSTIDHKFPVGRGGELLNTENMVVCCKWCNKDKDILTDKEYFYKQLHNTANGIRPE
ncbi:MAG: hypothetical protein DU489_07145 [Nitrosomonas sp.]|uniref:HNH endonuclease n=1 Tax=Nitrosomonas sp. TaxID=42353 RepID=UPI0032EE5446